MFGAYAIFLILRGASALFFAATGTVTGIYRVQTVGLDPFQLVLVGTALEASAFLFEVPTGVVADTFSRRLSIIIGLFLIGAGFILEGLVPRFGAVLAAQILWGVGYTFTSGATEAWIADEIGEARAGEAFLRGAQIVQVGGIAGILLGVWLGAVGLNLPIVFGGLAMVRLGLFMVVAMPETGFRPTPRQARTSWQAMGHTFREGVEAVRGRPLLLTILGITAFYGMSSEGFDRLWEAHFLLDIGFPRLPGIQPVVWFGALRLATLGLSIAAVEWVRRRVDTNAHVAVSRALCLTSALLVASCALFGLAVGFPLAAAAYSSATLMRRVSEPLYTAWLNQHVEPSVRATVFSIRSQSDALGQIAGGPVVGLIGSAVSLRAALVAAALCLTPALLLYAAVLRRDRTRTDPPVDRKLAV